jgi:hypothetical protein
MLVWVAKPTRQPSGSSSARAVTMNIGYSRSPTSELNVAAVSPIGGSSHGATQLGIRG